jgi:hypothetical protein
LRETLAKHGPAFERETADLLRAEKLNPSVIVGAVNRPAAQPGAPGPVAGATIPSAPVQPAPRPSAVERIRAIGRQAPVDAGAPALATASIKPAQPEVPAAAPSTPSVAEQRQAILAQLRSLSVEPQKPVPVAQTPAAPAPMDREAILEGLRRVSQEDRVPAALTPKSPKDEALERLKATVQGLKDDSVPAKVNRVTRNRASPELAAKVEAFRQEMAAARDRLKTSIPTPTPGGVAAASLKKGLAKTATSMKDEYGSDEGDPAAKAVLKVGQAIAEKALDVAAPGLGTAIKVIKRLGPKV